MKYSTTCECCLQKVTAYTHHLNAPLVLALKSLHEFNKANGGAEMGQLNLASSQYSNFGHLSYWDLAKYVSGKWHITERGEAFLFGELMVLDTVAVMARHVLPYDHEAWASHRNKPELVSVKDIMGVWDFKRKPEYQAEKSDQSSLSIF
jgi:hypothetical protein